MKVRGKAWAEVYDRILDHVGRCGQCTGKEVLMALMQGDESTQADFDFVTARLDKLRQCGELIVIDCNPRVAAGRLSNMVVRPVTRATIKQVQDA